MVKRLAIRVFCLALCLAFPAYSQDYRFTVDENRSDVYIREDGGIDIQYYITFTCDRGARAIDIVDVGLPNRHYELGSVRAWLDGVQRAKIRRSEYVDVGVEVHLQEKSISPGSSGTLQLTVTNPKMVFPDSDDPNYASVEFHPTWYGSKYAHGRTHMVVAFHFPPGAVKENVKWHYQKHDRWATDDQGRLVYVWENKNASPSKQYKFGVSFPKELVNSVYAKDVHKGPGLIARLLRSVSGFLGAILPIGIFVFFAVISALLAHRRRMKYYPPAALIEAGEIKRGLTAPEAAILLEIPLDKVLALIIFGLVKKGVVAVLPGEKLKLKILQVDEKKLRPYEKKLLKSIAPDGTVIPGDAKDMFISLIKSVHKKMKGFHTRDTREYYRTIVSNAWRMVERSGTADELGRNLEEQFEWIMVDKDADDRLKDSMQNRQVNLSPMWSRYYVHPHHGGGGSGAWMNGVDFADAVVSKIEGLADTAVGGLETFTGAITQTTNPPPKSSYSGGGGGGCACACAGCACACAGGGR